MSSLNSVWISLLFITILCSNFRQKNFVQHWSNIEMMSWNRRVRQFFHPRLMEVLDMCRKLEILLSRWTKLDHLEVPWNGSHHYAIQWQVWLQKCKSAIPRISNRPEMTQYLQNYFVEILLWCDAFEQMVLFIEIFKYGINLFLILVDG